MLATSTHTITPYSVIYKNHPDNFDFDANGEQVPSALVRAGYRTPVEHDWQKVSKNGRVRGPINTEQNKCTHPSRNSALAAVELAQKRAMEMQADVAEDLELEAEQRRSQETSAKEEAEEQEEA